jgi:hypothetical protein
MTVYAAELNVLGRRLWPAMAQPPATKVDQRSIAVQATADERLPEQEVATCVYGGRITEDAYLHSENLVDETAGGTPQRATPRRRSDGGVNG